MNEKIYEHGPYLLRVTGPASADSGPFAKVMGRPRHYEVARDGKVIAEWDYNYSADVFKFIEQGGKDFLLMMETYHGGQGCIDLSTGEKVAYDPAKDPEAPTGGFSEIFPKQREFWCWVQPLEYDEDSKSLEVEGCYWACPFTKRRFDLTYPMNPPYPVISELYLNEDDEDGQDGDQ